MEVNKSTYDFDTHINRRGTGALKYDELGQRFGNPDAEALWVADMDFAVPPEVSRRLVERFTHPVYGYATVPDSVMRSVIDWLRVRHGLTAERAELTFVPGIVRGLGYAINYFSNPGDGIVIQPPVYHPFRLLTQGNGRRVLNSPLIRTESGYIMDFDGLERVFAEEHPRLMILCNPHNPGGIQWDADALCRVADLALRYGVTVLDDEIHADLMLFGNRHIPFAGVSDAARKVCVTFGAPSKTFNIAGLAASWIYIPDEELRKGFFEWMEVNEFSAPGFPAAIAMEAAYSCGEPWLDDLIPYLEGNVKAVETFFADNMPLIRPMRPDASFLVWLDCRGLGLTQPQLDKMFLDAGLALNDGELFGTEGVGYMRLNIGMPRRDLLNALNKLIKH